MLETVTNPDESTVNYDYDVLDELIEKSYDEDEDVQALYGYDLDGNRITMDDAAGTTEYEYDEIGRITAVHLTSGKQILYSYDEYGNLSKYTSSETNDVQEYTYDNENRLKAITENGALLMAALYDGDGERIFRLDSRQNAQYTSNKGGTAESVIYSTGAGSGIAYDHDMIMDEMLIPNGIDDKNAINYELTGYINDINTEYSQVLMEYGASQSVTNIYEYGAQRNSATINGTKGYYLE